MTNASIEKERIHCLGNSGTAYGILGLDRFSTGDL